MTAAAARTVAQVDFSRKRVQRPTVAATPRLPHVVMTLALAQKIEAMVRSGELKDYAEAVQRLGWTRARVSQVMNLLLLAPAIQEAILDLPMTTGRDPGYRTAAATNRGRAGVGAAACTVEARTNPRSVWVARRPNAPAVIPRCALAQA